MARSGWMVVFVTALLISGCSREEGDEGREEKATESTHSSQLPADNVFSDQVKTLEKAESVQKTLDGAAAKEREAIEQQR